MLVRELSINNKKSAGSCLINSDFSRLYGLCSNFPEICSLMTQTLVENHCNKNYGSEIIVKYQK